MLSRLDQQPAASNRGEWYTGLKLGVVLQPTSHVCGGPAVVKYIFPIGMGLEIQGYTPYKL